MNSSKESLDDAFQKMVIQMKPYVLQNTNVKESLFIRAWIKKLCNEAIYSIAERKNRNLYALLLLTMLHDGSLDEPFTTLPTDGVLPTIPAYIVDHLNSIDVNKKKIGLEPSWLHEDSLLQDSLLSIENNLLVYKDIFSPQKRERFMLSSHFLLKKNQLNENVKQAEVFKSKFSNTNNENESHSFLDEDLEINNIKTEYHVRNIKKSSKINALHKTETGTGARALKIHKTNLEVQYQHDQIVEKHDKSHKLKVVELKDNEITDVKKFYEAKIEELEKINKGLESKISALNEELSTLKSANRHAIESLKKSEEKAAETEKEFEKILCDKLSGFELEMYKLQCSHRENIHQLVNEAEGKINSIKYIMEKDSSLLKEEIKKCNERLNSQTQFNETIERENYKYRHEQQEYKDIMEKQRIQIEEYNIKLQQQKNQAQEQEKLHQKFIDELNTKNEHILNLQKEQDLQILKKSSAISSLEAELVLLKETIELMKSNEKESKVSTHQEVVKLQCAHQQQMLLIKNELGNKLLEYENKLKKSDLLIIEKDEEIKRLLTNIDSHVNESNEAIESFKKKAEEDSANMFKELSIQLEVLQTSLRSARQKIEDNKVEFTKRLDEQRSMYEKQILSYKESFEFEKCQLKQQYDEQRSNLLKQIENQSNLQEQFLKSWKEEESKYKDQNDKHQKTIEEMESQVRSLRVEVIQANTLRKEQIVEIGLLRKEEQEAARRNEEALHSKYKNEIDEINLRLQKEHSIQLNLFTKKMNEQLRNIENEYSKKTAEDHNKIASLREELSAANKKAGEYEKQLQECMEMVSDERKKFSEYQNQSLLKREEMEEHYQNMLMKSDENLFCCRQEYENKLKGMLSSSVQQDLEDTISALREQLQIMQAHIDILQAELDVNKNYAKKVDVQKKRRDRIEKKKDLKRQTEKNIVKKKLHGSLLLFTKHFDARTKLSSHSSHIKRPLLPKREESLRRSVIDSPKKTVISRHIQPKHNNERQSIFTGKSIKVVAKNTTQCSLLDSPSTEKSPFTTSKLVKSNNQSNVTENRKQSLAAKVVVTNLHPNVTDDDIKELFGVLGDLRRASLTGLGSAEVIYKNTDDAFAAYSKYHGRNLDGQPMILKLTTTDENDMNNSGIIGRSSRHSQSAMQHYVPPPRLQSTKPVVFTVKL